MPTKIGTKSFSGASKIFDGTLSDALRGVAQFQAATVAKALADITDSSTGVSGGNTAAAVPLPAAFTSVGTDAAPKAGTETALTALRSAITTVGAAALVISNAISVDAFTVSTGGTDGAGTVAALTKTVTAVAGSAGTGIGYATAAPVLSAYRDELARLVKITNAVAVATGLTPVADNTGGSKGSTSNLAALVTATGTAATSGQAAAAGTMSKAAVDAFLTAAANVVATCSAKLNAATDGSRVVAPFVVAVA